ncbi:branched-chain amino acid ABC transporter permease [Deinococcus peraridilitoris]|uniref:ABC-type branched-chain amino acid transport system, permease component n=1 Tax=Deinococcus peraridilitoris (strain DSM 19664 / LMG 22246 / CIP 109416 / KR-200) TaxID=937777 RepID=K9ZYS1_DEIPD|nr:ABC-type branched-chain amino acid transport system, permease component [Deinococcus peraridilitoris DSM 19664]
MTTASLPPRAGRADRTWPLVAYAIITSLLMYFVAQGSIPALAQSGVLVLFLANLLFAYQWRAAPWAKLAVGLVSLILVLPMVGRTNGGIFDLAIQIGIFAALALGLNIVVGLAGLLDLGYVAFFAVGAYLWGIFASPQIGRITENPALAGGISGNYFWLFIILAVIAAALVGILIGLPVLKLRGDYLAIVTLGLGEVIRVLATNLSEYTNGSQGITPVKSAPVPWVDAIAGRLGFESSDFNLFFLYFLLLLIILVVVAVNVRLDRSRIGRSWIAIREDEVAAQAMGIPLVRTKLLAFAAGATFAGVMGVVFAAKQTFISPESFSFFQSIGVLSMVILGGMGSIPGVILGATVVTLLNLNILPSLSENLQSTFPNLNPQLDPAQYQRLTFGVILVLMMLFRPEGLLPSVRKRIELHEGDDQGDSLSTASERGATGGLMERGSDVYSPGLSTQKEDERSGEER